MAERLQEVPEAARGEYGEGFTNGATMISEALKAGVRPFRPVLDMPAPPPRFLGSVPEGVQFEAARLAPEVDPATGFLLVTSGARSAFFARGQVDGFDWALATIGQSLVRPIPHLVMPSRWISWKEHQEGHNLDFGAWSARVLWTPGQLAWSRKERGFPSQRTWRSWADADAPRWVALGERALWLETAGGQAIALDLESGGILGIRAAAAHEPSREESWESYNQDVIKEFHSPEFQGGLATLRTAAESGRIPDLLAVAEYLHGMGDEADREAYDWNLKAATKGNPEAMLKVGVCLFHGQPVPVDKVAARQWLERAKQAGEPHAAEIIQMLFEGGKPSQLSGTAD
ncbi:MAG TPA: tetratricopeptide repeat protein [Geothrix sp.]|nr:tetratricopeptide repeat protein [Geothrix sp.]